MVKIIQRKSRFLFVSVLAWLGGGERAAAWPAERRQPRFTSLRDFRETEGEDGATGTPAREMLHHLTA